MLLNALVVCTVGAHYSRWCHQSHVSYTMRIQMKIMTLLNQEINTHTSADKSNAEQVKHFSIR